MEFGDVQRAILGISGATLNTNIAKSLGVNETQGVYVASVEKGSGADKSGVKQGDVIKKMDGLSVSKFSDLSGYLGSKRPDDVVDVTVLRNGKEKHIPVTLVKLETFEIENLGLEVRNANAALLKQRGVDNGVIVSKALSKDMAQYNLEGIIITKINDEEIDNIDDAKRIINTRDYNAPIKITFVNQRGELNSFIFR